MLKYLKPVSSLSGEFQFLLLTIICTTTLSCAKATQLSNGGGGAAEKAISLKTFMCVGDEQFDKNVQLPSRTKNFKKQGPYKIYKTEHYLIRTRLDEDIVKDLARELDSFYEQVWAWLKIPDAKPTVHEPLELVLFKDKKALTQVVTKYKSPIYIPSTGVFYACYNKWNKIGLFHEGAHQVLDLVIDFKKFPLWFNEGIAANIGHAAKLGVDQFNQRTINSNKLQAGLSVWKKNNGRQALKKYRKIGPHARGWNIVYWLWNYDDTNTYDRWISYCLDGKEIPKNELKDIEIKVGKWLKNLTKKEIDRYTVKRKKNS